MALGGDQSVRLLTAIVEGGFREPELERFLDARLSLRWSGMVRSGAVYDDKVGDAIDFIDNRGEPAMIAFLQAILAVKGHLAIRLIAVCREILDSYNAPHQAGQQSTPNPPDPNVLCHSILVTSGQPFVNHRGLRETLCRMFDPSELGLRALRVTDGKRQAGKTHCVQLLGFAARGACRGTAVSAIDIEKVSKAPDRMLAAAQQLRRDWRVSVALARPDGTDSHVRWGQELAEAFAGALPINGPPPWVVFDNFASDHVTANYDDLDEFIEELVHFAVNRTYELRVVLLGYERSFHQFSDGNVERVVLEPLTPKVLGEFFDRLKAEHVAKDHPDLAEIPRFVERHFGRPAGFCWREAGPELRALVRRLLAPPVAAAGGAE